MAPQVVLYDADAEGNWALELPDYELALQEWLATEKPLQHTVWGQPAFMKKKMGENDDFTMGAIGMCI